MRGTRTHDPPSETRLAAVAKGGRSLFPTKKNLLVRPSDIAKKATYKAGKGLSVSKSYEEKASFK